MEKPNDVKMPKKGVSAISGNISPVVGEKNTYHVSDWYPDTPSSERNLKSVIWELFRKRSNGKFTTTNVRKKGDSSFTFGEASLGYTYRLEAYLYAPEGRGIIITPKPNKISQISKVELYYIDDTKGSSFSFMERLRAKAYCINMFNKEVVFTLWEDDAKGSGHNAGNTSIETQKAKIDKNGVAVAEFMLTKALMQKAMKGEVNTEKLEFYVTVEYYKHNKHATQNVEVENPYAQYYKPKPYQPPVIPKAKGSPAEQKPASQKEEKGIIDTAIDKMKELWDWGESKGTATKEKSPTILKPEGRSAVSVGELKKEERKEESCFCKQYDLVWGNKVSCEFRKKVVVICSDLWGEENKLKMANGLMAVMYVETGGSFKAHQIMGSELKDVNSLTNDDFFLHRKDGSKSSRAVGLIQFTQSALEKMGEFSKGSGFDKLHEVKLRFAKMGEVKQLDYVKKYFELNFANTKIKNPEDIYLHVFAPAGVNKSDDYILYSKGTEKYRQNKSVDMENNKDGKIQRSEILGRYRISYAEGLGNKAEIFTCLKVVSNSLEKKQTKIDWHDPVDNPMVCLYTQNGNYRPRYNVFGKVRKEREKHNHQGIDLLALPGSNAYACVDAYVEYIDIQQGYGNVICLKVKDPKSF